MCTELLREKATTDPHLNAAIETHELRSENTVSRHDVGFYTRVGVKNPYISIFIIIGFDLRLLRNTKFGHMRIGKSIIFR